MPIRQPWTHEVVKFDNKGLDLIHPVDQVDAQHYSRFINVKSVQEGSLQPRPGSSLINTEALDIPAFGKLTQEENSGEDALCVVSGASNAFGANMEFIASTAFIAKWCTLTVGPFGDPDISDFAFEIRTGVDPGVKLATFFTTVEASGGIKSTDSTVLSFPLPSIPAGTRISMVLKDLLTDTGKERCFTMNFYG